MEDGMIAKYTNYADNMGEEENECHNTLDISVKWTSALD